MLNYLLGGRGKAFWLTIIAVGIAAILSGRCARSQTAPPPHQPTVGPPSTLPAGWDQIDQRMVFLAVQLSTVESSLAATDKSLQLHGYEKALREGDAQKALDQNDKMDRNGGGPVPWQEFYGKAAEKFFYHPPDQNTAYVNPHPVAQRPPQFDYIYRANEQSKRKADDEVRKIGGKIEDLLAYRRQLESEQSALWGKIAFRGDSSLDLASRPLYRMGLAAGAADDAGRQSVEAAAAAVAFMLAIDAELADAQRNLSTDQQGTLDHLLQVTTSARAELSTKLLALPAMSASLGDPRTPLGRFSRASRRLEDSAQNVIDAFRLAADCDSKDDQAGRRVYRGQLQQNIFDYAAAFATADHCLTAAIAEWKLKTVEKVRTAATAAGDSSTPNPTFVRTVPTAPEGRIVRLTRALPPEWQYEGTLQVVPDGILLPDLHYIRSAEGDSLDRDFTLDLWLAIDPKNPTTFVGVGSGQNGIHTTPVNSIFMVIHPNGNIGMATREGVGESGMGREEDPGEYVVRLEKKGTAVTYSVGSIDHDGKFDAEVTETFPDISKTPADFNERNMHIFFGGGKFRQMRFAASSPHKQVAGLADAPLPTTPQVSTLAANLPPFLECATSYSVTRDGVQLPIGHFIRTRQGGFLQRDFVFDVWLAVNDKMQAALIGLGSGIDDNGGTPSNSLFLIVQRRIPGFSAGGRSGRALDEGEYIARIEKKGAAVTFSVGTEKNGVFDADFTETFPDISKIPGVDFNKRNMHIFFGNGLYTQFRLTATPQK